MATSALQLANQFVVTGPQLNATPVPVTPALYSELDQQFNGFRDHTLVSLHTFNNHWTSWEKHPAGDEIVMLLSGEAHFCLEGDDREEWVHLTQAGEYVIVPRNTWHTADVPKSAQLLFITPGEDTQHRERKAS